MAKKQWTEEQRKAFGEKMKAARAKKVAETETPVVDNSQAPEPETETVTQPDFSNVPAETVVNSNDTNELLRRVIELQAMMMNNQAAPQAPAVQNGKLTGTIERYSIDRTNYPDPCERLAAEPRLERFAFKYNYQLEFGMTTTSYTTIDNVRMSEPKFTLKLIAKVIDQMSGDDTGGRYVLCSMIFFEDPEAAIIVANDNGLQVDSENEAAFLNEMRYLRMRDWLISAFYPEQVTTQAGTSERVIDNRVVDFYTESNADGKVKIPFDNLTKYKV